MSMRKTRIKSDKKSRKFIVRLNNMILSFKIKKRIFLKASKSSKIHYKKKKLKQLIFKTRVSDKVIYLPNILSIKMYYFSL